MKVEIVTHISDASLLVIGDELQSSADGQDMYAAINGVTDQLSRQRNRQKDNLQQR
ncbi:HPF/RaiA family ribosome-associated protein [Enterobacter quasiroggenkampii]|nr:HPF/RaiA family ribosome-associated protein [Enterobacter quasiroggenkampii]